MTDATQRIAALLSQTPNPALAGRQPGASFDTALQPLDEMAYRQWVAQNGVPTNPNATAPQDYDMRGFYQALQQQNPRAMTAVNPNDNRMHFPDYWKTPLHETFSNESQWAPPNAPIWNNQDQLLSQGGRVIKDERAPPMGLFGLGAAR
jgi:hypothetical protein